MLTRIAGGRVIDPGNNRDEIGDVWISNGRISTPPSGKARPDASYDATGKVVMAGAIDIHSHIAGSNVNVTRLLMPDEHPGHQPAPPHAPLSTAGWSTFETGCRYAAMGFTTVVEPAVAPHHALHAHLELADIPIIDKATLAVLGNDDFLLGLMRAREGSQIIRDYVAWTLSHAKGLGLKIINAGGCAAFKFNARSFGLDDVVPAYGVTSRAVLQALQHAVTALGVPHPVHVHCNNLGLAGNVATAVARSQPVPGAGPAPDPVQVS